MSGYGVREEGVNGDASTAFYLLILLRPQYWYCFSSPLISLHFVPHRPFCCPSTRPRGETRLACRFVSIVSLASFVSFSCDSVTHYQYLLYVIYAYGHRLNTDLNSYPFCIHASISSSSRRPHQNKHVQGPSVHAVPIYPAGRGCCVCFFFFLTFHRHALYSCILYVFCAPTNILVSCSCLSSLSFATPVILCPMIRSSLAR